MTNEDRRERRGEPVLLDGRVPCTIEWGDEEHGFSLYRDDGGGREIVERHAGRVTPDPGGARPLWQSLARRS